MNDALSFGSAPIGDKDAKERGEASAPRHEPKLEDDMFKSLFTAAALMALMLGATVLASEAAENKSGALAGDELRQAVSGKIVYLKISGFELPIHYAAGGTMSGSMNTVMATLARGDGSSDRGKWWIEGNQLCQRWNVWMDGKSYCYTFAVKGSAVQWVRNDGRSGTARIAG
ncbi:MAG: hypothetical protein FJX44_03445 [Alphaproteobacteria bacterium]|nr:hypothetical protein [Alphaproteobacteria bacterium]